MSNDAPAVLVISNLREGDTTFTHEHGTWNVTRAFADCMRGKHSVYLFDVEEVLVASAAIEIDPDKVDEYTSAPDLQHFKPIFVVLNGKLWLIDGIHHLRAMARRGIRQCAGYVIEDIDNAPYRVRFNGQDQMPLAKGNTTDDRSV